MKICILTQAGDTLVEVTMALAILSVILVTGYSVANTTIHTGIQARERTESAQVAQSQAELLRAWRDFDETISVNRIQTDMFNQLNAKCKLANPCAITETTSGPKVFKAVSCGGSPGPPCQTNRYTVSVSSVQPGADQVDLTIDVSWASLASPGVTNHDVINFSLVDTSGITPINCDAQPEACI